MTGKAFFAVEDAESFDAAGDTSTFHSRNTIRRSPASHPRTPAIKSSNGVLSPRLFFERSPSARTSKGFLIVGTRFATRKSSSMIIPGCFTVPSEFSQFLSRSYNKQFKSRRPFRRAYVKRKRPEPWDLYCVNLMSLT
jgi:hypothetical protein